MNLYTLPVLLAVVAFASAAPSIFDKPEIETPFFMTTTLAFDLPLVNFDCSNHEDGHYASSSDCRTTFIACIGGRGFELSCPTGLQFDPVHLVCEHLENIEACGGLPATAADEDSELTTSTLVDEPTTTTPALSNSLDDVDDCTALVGRHDRTGAARKIGPVVIRTDHNTYIQAHPGHFARVDQVEGPPGDWSRFMILEYPDGKVAFRTVHGTYLRADDKGNINTQDSAKNWEKFEVFADNGKYVFLSHHRKFMTAEDGGEGAPITANRNKADTWEQFELGCLQ